MSLDMKAELGALTEAYKKDARQTTFNCLVTSESGCGKTFLARTCRFPVHIDSFDPGGTKGLAKWIASGDIVVDTTYEGEIPERPFAYSTWLKNFKRRAEGGYFDHFGTYILDSATTWSAAIMNWIMNKDKLAGTAPRFTKDYVPQKVEINNRIRDMMNLPCDFILTGHLKLIEDPESGRHKFRFLTTGDGMVTIPLLFDELWTLRTRSTANDVEYQLLTKSTGLYLARSRMAGDGAFNAVEVPDIKALLKKAGRDYSDKPKLSTLTNV